MPHSGATKSDKQPDVANPRHVVAIAASTGGPTAVTEIVSKLATKASYSVLVAQHMPENFTRIFAERLNRYSALRVVEANDGDRVTANTVFICPGRLSMELEQSKIGRFRIRLRQPSQNDRYVPSANRLFSSVAGLMGASAVGIVLTGMGDDGVEGSQRIIKAGGTVVVESEETAVVYGMPRAVIRAGAATCSLPLHGIVPHLMKLVGR
jgi:two-component system chemotaxis response regulator CheB